MADNLLMEVDDLSVCQLEELGRYCLSLAAKERQFLFNKIWPLYQRLKYGIEYARLDFDSFISINKFQLNDVNDIDKLLDYFIHLYTKQNNVNLNPTQITELKSEYKTLLIANFNVN